MSNQCRANHKHTFLQSKARSKIEEKLNQLVPTGGIPSHQLLGTPSSLSSDEGVREDLAKYISATPLGQCNRGGIYQPERGVNLQQVMSASHLNVDVVPRKEHHLGCRTPSRSPQCDCRPGIMFHEGSLPLDAQP